MVPDPALFLLLAAAPGGSLPFETPGILVMLFLSFWSLSRATPGLPFLAGPLPPRGAGLGSGRGGAWDGRGPRRLSASVCWMLRGGNAPRERCACPGCCEHARGQ